MNYLICGAPGSGKTTYVKSVKRWDDYVVDLDYLYHALTYNPLGEKPFETYEVMQKVYFAMIDLLQEEKDKNIYIIRCAPTREERESFKTNYHTQNILIKCHSISCQKRRCRDVRNLNVRTRILKSIDRWFASFQDGAIDKTVNGY